MSHDPTVRIDLEQTCSAGYLSSFPDQWADALLALDQSISSVVGRNTPARESLMLHFVLRALLISTVLAFVVAPLVLPTISSWWPGHTNKVV